MGFLKCKSCGGYYKLQGEESPDDFGACRCGGSLKHVRSLKAAKIDEFGQFNKLKLCSKCGKENVKTSQICVFCGQKLDKDKKLTRFNGLLRFLAIFIGIIIVLIPLILFSIGPDMIIIGSFVASVLVSKNEKEGILNGIILGLISGLFFAYNGVFSIAGSMSGNTDLVYVIIIGSAIIGLLGGLSGAIARSTIINKDSSHSVNFKAIIMGFILCIIPILYLQSLMGLLMAVSGGIVAAYWAGGEYKGRIQNGFLTGSLSALLLVLLFIFNHLNDPAIITDKILPIGVTLIMGGLLGTFGGLIGVYIKKSKEEEIKLKI